MFNTLNSINSLGASGISLLRILGGISKSLGIAREILPIYNEVKPLIQKFPQFLERVNSIRNYTFNKDNYYYEDEKSENSPSILTNTSVNNPSFFQ